MEGFQIKNIEATNLDELKKLIESTLKAVEAVEENLEKINNFEIKVIQKPISRQEVFKEGARKLLDKRGDTKWC
ncbi:TPA: hypothetical protein ACN3HF_000546 [Staphylococcus aureus]